MTEHLVDKQKEFFNRLKKNAKRLESYIQGIPTNAYRLYDKDIPELPYQVDIYHQNALISEKGKYLDPENEIELQKRDNNIEIIQNSIHELLEISPQNQILQIRSKGKSIEREKGSLSDHFLKNIVQEGKAKFHIKLGEYLDSGLFLDHRPQRLYLSKTLAKLKNKTDGHFQYEVLNLFSYTSSFSIHLAIEGAYTTNVDLSNTYLDWAEDNFALNNLDLYNHQFIREDVLQFLKNPQSQKKYDLIILDPPSFSNSKKMIQKTFEVQKDYAVLIYYCCKMLKQNGTIIFSTNLREFKFDQNHPDFKDFLSKIHIKDITSVSIPLDFRDQKIHQCYTINFIK